MDSNETAKARLFGEVSIQATMIANDTHLMENDKISIGSAYCIFPYVSCFSICVGCALRTPQLFIIINALSAAFPLFSWVVTAHGQAKCSVIYNIIDILWLFWLH